MKEGWFGMGSLGESSVRTIAKGRNESGMVLEVRRNVHYGYGMNVRTGKEIGVSFARARVIRVEIDF